MGNVYVKRGQLWLATESVTQLLYYLFSNQCDLDMQDEVPSKEFL